ncbi:hypothetical protein FBU30_000196 [Linnemannia zychae]|nr:hypothetical protein FBU30_000196 [Linnemannia zychae]
MESNTPKDSDMASPPSTFHASFSSQSTLISTEAPTTHGPDSQSKLIEVPAAPPQLTAAAAAATTTTTTSTKGRKIVNDGYIYHPYEEYSQISDKDTHENDGESGFNDNQASAIRILELRGLERRIIQLLETAGQAIQILSGEDDAENSGPILMEAGNSADKGKEMIQTYAQQKSQQFDVLAAGYATLVNEIQSGLRKQFHYLTKAGIASSQVPFKNVVYGEEKELETWLNAVDVLKESTVGLIEKVEREYLGIHKKVESSQSSSNPVATNA